LQPLNPNHWERERSQPNDKTSSILEFSTFCDDALKFQHFKQVYSKKLDTSKNTSITAEPEKGIFTEKYEFLFKVRYQYRLV
jgi:ssDNA-specific exonuclease RecJ